MSWNIDPSHSTIGFTVKHMMFTTVRGQFDKFEGTIDFDSDDPLGSTAAGTVDVNSIDTNDTDRDNHLRSADFFDVATYPNISFKSTRIERVGDNNYKVYGDFTIKDVTHEIVWDVKDNGQGQDPWGNQRRALSATTSISRKDYGITWNVGLETGGWLVGDTVNLSAEVQLVLATEEAGVTA